MKYAANSSGDTTFKCVRPVESEEMSRECRYRLTPTMPMRRLLDACHSPNQLTGVQLGAQTNLSYYYNAGTDNGQIATLVDAAHNRTID